MNKMKLLYDVVTTLKNKEQVNGIVSVNIRREQETVFSLQNEFEKNMAGQTKAKICSELNMDGKKVKHESSTEFTGHCHHHRLEMMRRFHHHGMAGCGGIKEKFSRIAFVLGILNSLKVEEQENGAAVVSLSLSEIPEELKMMLREKMNQRRADHPHFGFLKECHTVETLDGDLILNVNNAHEIEKIVVNVNGRVQNAEKGQQALEASAELNFTW
jgi:NADH dehydrogenase/NADH:ubiquinone oxidoreductase subunit G